MTVTTKYDIGDTITYDAITYIILDICITVQDEIYIEYTCIDKEDNIITIYED